MAIQILVCSSPIKTLDGVNMMEEIAEWRRLFGEGAIKICFDWPDSALGTIVDPQMLEVERIKAIHPAGMGVTQSFRDAMKKTKWWSKYTSKVMGGVETAIQSAVEPTTFYMACLDGGPISQVEQSEMPSICRRVRKDLEELRRAGIQRCEVKVKNFESRHEIYGMLKQLETYTMLLRREIYGMLKQLETYTMPLRRLCLKCESLDNLDEQRRLDLDMMRILDLDMRRIDLERRVDLDDLKERACLEGTYHIAVQGGTHLGRILLSCRSDGFVDLHHSDGGHGRQQWTLIHVEGDIYNIQVKGGTVCTAKFLSCTRDGKKVDLFQYDDCSGRQQWRIVPVYRNGKQTFYHIEVNRGVDTNRHLLSCTPNGQVIDLFHRDDESGRQKWQLTPA